MPGEPRVVNPFPARLWWDDGGTMLFVGMWLEGCKVEQGVTTLVPEIAVAQSTVEFGDVAVLTQVDADVIVSNAGRAPLEGTVSVDGDGFSASPAELDLGPDEDAAVTVTFAPTTYLTYAGTLSIASNDVESPLIELPLTGTGVPQPTPDIAVAPLNVDFGPVAPSSSGTKYFTITNEGDADLHLGVVAQAGSGAFSLLTDASDQIIAADGQLPVVIAYSPTSDEGDNGTLTIPSDDPDEPSVVIQLLGNGGGDAAYPVAVANCPETVDPPVRVDVDGSDSSDPNDHTPLTYSWRLVSQPDGSQSELDETELVGTSFFADLAGDYDLDLTVTNSLGVRSAPARCRIQAIPSDDLHVEMVWDGLRSDVDLHLRQQGTDLFDRPGDCNWCNRTPAWGASLDLDDRSGLGPENINVASPDDGGYDVAAHYFDDDGDGSIVVTVRVWTYGALTSERSHRMERNEVWEVGRVNWPDGTLGVVDSIDTADVRECR
jgi:hypothetical protein